MTGAPPQVVRHDDGSYALLNVDLDGLTQVQRIAVGVTVWEQVRTLMEISGEYKPKEPHMLVSSGIGSTEDIDRVVATLIHTSLSSLNRLRPRLLNNPTVLKQALWGEIESVDDVSRALGMQLVVRLSEGRPSKAKHKHSFFGHGDKFYEATEPLVRYLSPWKKRDFRFTHINPKEAKRRIKRLDALIADLQRTREDLAERAHVASYAAPSERKKGAHR